MSISEQAKTQFDKKNILLCFQVCATHVIWEEKEKEEEEEEKEEEEEEEEDISEGSTTSFF